MNVKSIAWLVTCCCVWFGDVAFKVLNEVCSDMDEGFALAKAASSVVTNGACVTFVAWFPLSAATNAEIATTSFCKYLRVALRFMISLCKQASRRMLALNLFLNRARVTTVFCKMGID